MVNITENDKHLSMRDHIMQVPPVGRVRCLEAFMAQVEAAPRPVPWQDKKIDIMAAYRGMLEGVLRILMLRVWQGCARQVFAAADPVKFIAGGPSGINADAPRGLDEKSDRVLLDTIKELELEMAQLVYGPVRRSRRAATTCPRCFEQRREPASSSLARGKGEG